jgi:hypothetical protein
MDYIWSLGCEYTTELRHEARIRQGRMLATGEILVHAGKTLTPATNLVYPQTVYRSVWRTAPNPSYHADVVATSIQLVRETSDGSLQAASNVHRKIHEL